MSVRETGVVGLRAVDVPDAIQAFRVVRPASRRIEAAAHPPVFADVRVWIVALTGFCVFLTVYATQTLLPLFTKVFGATKFGASLTVSATTVAIALAAPAVGLLAERVGRRRTMALAISLLTLPILLTATAGSLQTLIAWRFAQGLLMPGIIAVTLAYVSDEWADGGAAAVMSAYIAGNVLGGVTGRFLSGVVAARFGWQAAFLLLGIFNALGAAAVWRWLPPSSVAARPLPLRSALAEMRRHFRKPQLVATFGVGAASLFGLVATFTYITFHLAGPPFRLGTTALAYLFLVYFVGVVVTPLCGRWIDRLGHRRALVMAALGSAVGVAITLIPSVPMVVTGLAVCSSGIFVCQSAAASYLGHVAGSGRASAAGIYTTFYYTGGTLGAAVPAAAWAVGGWPGCVAVTIAVLAGGAALAHRYWRE